MPVSFLEKEVDTRQFLKFLPTYEMILKAVNFGRRAETWFH